MIKEGSVEWFSFGAILAIVRLFPRAQRWSTGGRKRAWVLPDTVIDVIASDLHTGRAGGPITIASADATAGIKTGRDRRSFFRHSRHELRWIRLARLQFGQGVLLVDLSRGGARIDSTVALGPNAVSALELEIVGGGIETIVPFRVLRCEVGALTASGLVYRGACEFIRPLDLPALTRPSEPARAPVDVLELDVALKTLLARVGAPGDPDRLSPAQVLHTLKALHARAAVVFSDPMGQRLNAFLRLVVPALEHRTGLAAVLEHFESQLRRVVPHARVRFVGAPEKGSDPGFNTVVIGLPDNPAGGPLVRVDLPRNLKLTEWQLRVLRATGRLIALMQRLEPNRDASLRMAQRPAVAPVFVEMNKPGQTAAPEPLRLAVGSHMTRPDEGTASFEPGDGKTDEAGSGTVFQKVVVRYAEGQSLKGYTQDFHASRPHFTLWSSPSETAGDAVIVPLVRLKAIFFVRDFAGNPRYVERTDIADQQPGRRIEVTLSDDEVIVGTTLNFRSGGHGFFVTPIDPLANNLRVFIVANSVRQVRFPSVRREATA